MIAAQRDARPTAFVREVSAGTALAAAPRASYFASHV